MKSTDFLFDVFTGEILLIGSDRYFCMKKCNLGFNQDHEIMMSLQK